MKNKKGFTFIEILTVVTMLGILAGIISIAVIGAAGRSRDARRKADLDLIKKALGTYAIDNGGYPMHYKQTGSGGPGIYRDAMCNAKVDTNLNNAWITLQSQLKGYLAGGILPTDPKGRCKGTYPTHGDPNASMEYVYLTEGNNIFGKESVRSKYFSLWAALENAKDPDTDSRGGQDTDYQTCGGQYQNLFGYIGICNISGGGNINIKNNYGVGTAKPTPSP